MALQPFVFDLDDLAVLEFTVLRRDNTVYDLTAATVTMLVEGVGTFSCAVTNATAGLCTRTVLVGDFPRANRYRAQLKVVSAGGTFHTDIFIIQVSESIDSTASGSIPPLFFPFEGGILFGATGGQAGQDLANLFWDDSLNNLQLFGGTVGTSGSKILALGIGTAPSTSPSTTIQLWAANSSGANTGSLFILDEVGSLYYIGGFTADTGKYALQTSSGRMMSFGHGGTGNSAWLGTDTSEPLLLQTNGTRRIRIDTNGNIGFNTDSFGSSAVGILAVGLGTAPTGAAADVTQIWSDDRNGAGTNSLFVRTEDSGITERMLAWLIHATDMTEHTTTSTTTVDLATLTTNIGVNDAFSVVCRYRKSVGSATAAQLGLKLNGTQILNNFAVTSAVSQAEDGMIMFGGPLGMRPGVTNYTHSHSTAGASIATAASTPVGGAAAGFSTSTYAAAIPSATITSITITGAAVNASQTLAIRDIVVYRIATT